MCSFKLKHFDLSNNVKYPLESKNFTYDGEEHSKQIRSSHPLNLKVHWNQAQKPS